MVRVEGQPGLAEERVDEFGPTSGGNSCIPVGQADSPIGVRDTNDKRPDATILAFGTREWRLFTADVASGDQPRARRH
jgi:hypothetical protein